MIRGVQRSGALLFALMLTGCVVKQQTPAPVEPTQPTTPTQPEQPPAQPVPPPQTAAAAEAENHQLECQRPAVSRQYGAVGGRQSGQRAAGGSHQNSTNGSLQTEKATAAIENALANNGKFSLVSNDQLNQAKQTLGLSPEDSPQLAQQSDWRASSTRSMCCTATRRAM